MKQQTKKQENWLKILLSYAAPCRGKMAGSVLCAVVSVTGGFVPYLAVYEILRLFIEGEAEVKGIAVWSGIAMAGYLVKIVFYGISTVLSHVSAYTILEGLRLQIADRLMRAPLGTVLSKPIGHLKNTIVDRWRTSSRRWPT